MRDQLLRHRLRRQRHHPQQTPRVGRRALEQQVHGADRGVLQVGQLLGGELAGEEVGKTPESPGFDLVQRPRQRFGLAGQRPETAQDQRVPAAHLQQTPGQLPALVPAVEQTPQLFDPLEVDDRLGHRQRPQRHPERPLRRRQRRKPVTRRHQQPGPGLRQSVRQVHQQPVPLAIGAGVAGARDDLLELGLEVVEHQQQTFPPQRLEQVVAKLTVPLLPGKPFGHRQKHSRPRLVLAELAVGLTVQGQALVQGTEKLVDRELHGLRLEGVDAVEAAVPEEIGRAHV